MLISLFGEQGMNHKVFLVGILFNFTGNFATIVGLAFASRLAPDYLRQFTIAPVVALLFTRSVLLIVELTIGANMNNTQYGPPVRLATPFVALPIRLLGCSVCGNEKKAHQIIFSSDQKFTGERS